ncbi:hypothetical protein CVT26_007528 [Gymnopilus dilepis]|uniref:LysM domain-containing protein n=1 Tax=Gymnopilus dilepis TaxID=231916 RepID=A0A409WZ01_9AGAR|nr:hypothetical protein CVT26_007528 [Gymnopilus dilepis]
MEFLSLNPEVKTDCTNLALGEAYCVKAVGQPGGGTGTQIPPNVVAGTDTQNCTRYDTVVSGDTCPILEARNNVTDALFRALNPEDCAKYDTVISGDTCPIVEARNNITDTLFRALNPEINAACTNIQLGGAYCVQANPGFTPSATPTSTTTTTTPSSQPTAPTNIAAGSWTNMLAPRILLSSSGRLRHGIRKSSLTYNTFVCRLTTPAKSPMILNISPPDVRRPPPDLASLKVAGERILWIDTVERRYQPESHHVKHAPNHPYSFGQGSMLPKIRSVVGADLQRPLEERIDSVLWYVDYSWEPEDVLWEALDGLSPKHLHLVCGMWNAEDCNVEPLDELHNGSNLVPPHATRLKQLRILGNNASDLFILAIDDKLNPDLRNTLEVLEVSTIGNSTNLDYVLDLEPRDFRDRLRKCIRLRELRYATGCENSADVDLAPYIPPSVEHLSLKFKRSRPLLADMDTWIRHASDPTWLPHLKSFKLDIDASSPVQELEGNCLDPSWAGEVVDVPPEEFSVADYDWLFEDKKAVLCQRLKRLRPDVDVPVCYYL